MSVNDHSLYPEVDPKQWEQYLNECRASGAHPTIGDFLVYKSDLDIDEDTTDYAWVGDR